VSDLRDVKPLPGGGFAQVQAIMSRSLGHLLDSDHLLANQLGLEQAMETIEDRRHAVRPHEHIQWER
jgi:hypothetical protein